MSDTPDMAKRFLAELNRRRLGWAGALVLAALIRWLGWTAAAFGAYCLGDYFFGFPPATLIRLNSIFIAVSGTALVSLTLRAMRVRRRTMATRADERLGDGRGGILGAYELATASRPAGEMEQFLTDRAVADAEERLHAARWSALLPLDVLKRRGATALIKLVATALLLGIPWSVSSIVISRIFHPLDDIPPFSFFTFDVKPDAPVVVYGDDVELGVDIGGPAVSEGVWLITRQGGEAGRSPCFQESARHFTQRIGKVTREIEFAFSTGRARSTWHKVQVQLEPRIVVARLHVEPPPYSLKPPREFIAGQQGLQDLKGTKVRLEITSNRPLGGGHIVIKPRDGSAPAEVTGTKAGTHRVRYEWTLGADATIEAFVTDVQGARNREPYRMQQRALPDEPPRAYISEPGLFAVATPKAVVRIAGSAEDDLGIQRMDLFRALAGYRDRSENMGPATIRPQAAFARELDLGRLGVEPGQTLEFFVEATDTNPDQTGRAASEIARIRIIDDEEYAQMLRERTTTEEFMQRFAAAEQALQELRQKLKETEDQLAAKAADTNALQRKLNDLKKANDDAAKLFQQLAQDLPIFEMEKEAQKTFRETAQALAENQKTLSGASPQDKDLAKKLEEIRKRLGEEEKKADQQAQDAKEAAAVARVMEMGNAFKEIVAAQEELVRRFGRYADAKAIDDPVFFRGIQRRQEEIRQALTNFQQEITARAKDLPAMDELEELRDSAMEFASKIDDLQIPPVMGEAAKAAQESVGQTAKDKAELALERLKSLMSKCNSKMGSACKKLKFSVSDCMRNTMNQLMQGMGRNKSKGQGQGQGAGGQPGDSDGYSEGSSSPMNIPMYGAGRSAMPQGTAQVPGKMGSNRGLSNVMGERSGEHGTGEPGEDAAGGPGRIEDAPEKYRDAIKRYFGDQP